MINDQFEAILQQFKKEQGTTLRHGRYPSFLRAVVVDTADPLNMGRVRFKCPELHDVTLKDEIAPWAVPAPTTGGPNAGDWANPCIGDVIFICFEKDHAHAPIYIAAGDPTKRRQYPNESIHIETPVFLDNRGDIANDSQRIPNPPDDYMEDYLPADRRPMSRGIKDRYGNLILLNSVGYYPSTHYSEDKENNPLPNAPDLKFMAMVSKYGHMLLLNDIGYEWLKDEDGEIGEFSGDSDEDARFEIDRAKYLQRLAAEDKPNNLDQRRIELRSRAGHKFEMRDVGFNNTRANEYAEEESVLISSSDSDQRWVKWVTKGGHLIQMIDKGSDPEEDLYYKRNLIDEIGSTHSEDDWDDARQIRMITRYGFKFVLDDRGSSETDASGQETPRGNGFLVKGRRSKTGSATETVVSGSSDERGYGIEFNEKDEINAMKLYSPNSQLLEINDKYGFVLLCTQLPFDISRPYQGSKENEFSLSSGRQNQGAEKQTFHLILDKENEYTRLKTPKLQGIESRDKEEWTEVRDPGDRGVWFNDEDKIALLRSGENNTAFVMLDDNQNAVFIQNQDGKIQIYCSGPIEVISDDDINMKANNINIRAKTSINMTASGISAKLAGGALGCSGDIKCDNLFGFIPEADKPLHTNGKGIAKPAPVGSTTPNPQPNIRERSELSPEPDNEERGNAANFPTAPVSEDVVK